jgi:hypothetical protein
MSYLSIFRNIEALGIDVLDYFINKFSLFYDELIKYLVTAKSLQLSCLCGMVKLKGEGFINEVVNKYSAYGTESTNVFDALYKAQKKNGTIYVDTRILDIIIRYKKVNAISQEEQNRLLLLFSKRDFKSISKQLLAKIENLRRKMIDLNKEELGQEIIFAKIDEKINKIKRVLEIFGE